MIAASSVIDTLADIVAGVRLARPIRVGVDGRSAAGKTTLADALADALRTRRRDALRAAFDDVHRPGHKHRSERGEWTPRSYYDESYDSLAFRDLLLRPLGPGGGRRCRVAMWDAIRDLPIEEKWIEATDRAILVVERYRQRVIPSHLLYEALVRPVERADAVVDTRDVQAPRLVRLGAMTSV